MTLDEAIKHCESIAEKCIKDGAGTELYECGKDHRQLANWLKELKEAKRLLKQALEDMNDNNICYDIKACNVCTESQKCPCDTFRWRYTDDVEKLLKQ